MMAIQYLTEADKWKSILSCLAGKPFNASSAVASDEEYDYQPQGYYSPGISSPLAISDGVDLFACSSDSPSEVEVEIFSHPNSDDEDTTEGYCSDYDDFEPSNSLTNTSSNDNPFQDFSGSLNSEPTIPSVTSSSPPNDVYQPLLCPEIRVESVSEDQRIQNFLALEAEASSLLDTFLNNPTSDSSLVAEFDDFDTSPEKVDMTPTEVNDPEPIVRPFNDAPFPSLSELEAFEAAVLAKSAIGNNPHVDKYVTMGAFILLVRAQINIEHYKDFVCSAFLISWFQLEESFALPDRLEETHTADELIQIHVRMWTLVNNMSWRSSLDVQQLDAAAALFRDYPQMLRPRLNPPKSF